MDTLPPLFLRHSILPYLSSTDALALKLTKRWMARELRDLRTNILDAHSPRVHYWCWLFRTLKGYCRCGICKPYSGFYYILAKNSNPRILRHFVSTAPFQKVLSDDVSILRKMVRGAIESQNLQHLQIVRGVIPMIFLESAPKWAVQYNNDKAFNFLLDVGHSPMPWQSMTRDIYTLAGINGNPAIYRRLLADDVHNGDLELVWDMAKEAIIYNHPDVIDSIRFYDLAAAFDRELLLLTIRYDRLKMFLSIMETGVWVNADDSSLVMLYNSRTIARKWWEYELPVLPHVRAWMIKNNQAPYIPEQVQV